MNENYHIHTLKVSTMGEKKLFQIKQPRNAKKITGILVTALPLSLLLIPASAFIKDGKKYFSLKAGNISLKLHNPRDIFFSDDVLFFEIMPDYETLTGIQKFGFDDGGFSTQGNTINYRNINIESKETIIEGYYADTTLVNDLIPYQLKIYIRYETEQ